MMGTVVPVIPKPIKKFRLVYQPTLSEPNEGTRINQTLLVMKKQVVGFERTPSRFLKCW